ncbi:ComEC/Rec2 family competence protein [Halovulum dunhuangense]|uniref:ComEC/Rec2 family competence protein n=1 Tax=Halovulum dunhuangense TaxID=1505036 RepID=UPI0031B64615
MRLSAGIEAQRGTLLLWAPAAMAVGICVYFALKSEPGLGHSLTLGGSGAVLLGLHLWRRRGSALALAGLACLGFALADAQTARMQAPVLERITFGAVMGRVVGLDRSEQNRIRVRLDQVWIEGLAPEKTPHRVRIVLARPPDPGTLAPGNRIMLRARLTPPLPPVEPRGFDFRRHAWFDGLGAIGSSAEPVVLAEPPTAPPAALWLFSLRMQLSDAIRARMPAHSGGFAAAILFGDRSGVDPADLVDLRVSNLAHLLAISGLHMGLLTGAMFVALRLALAAVPGVALCLPAKKIAALGAMAAGAGYLALSGASVATQRAFIMAAVVFCAVLADRPALTLRAVALAGLILLVIDPFAVMGAGFQMSFAATIALIATYGALQSWAPWRRMDARGGRVLRFALGLALTSLVAGLATAPFSAFHFHQMSRYGLIANILAVPAMGFVVMPSALIAALLWPFGLEGVALWLMQLGIDHILAVAGWAASLPAPLWLVPAGPGWALGLIALGGYALATLRGPPRLAGLPVAALAIAFWAATPRPDVMVDPDGALVGVRGAEGLALNRARGAGFAARVWLENDGDAADQRAAAARTDGAGGEAVEWRLPDGRRVLWLKSAPEGGSACVGVSLVIAPGAGPDRASAVPAGCSLIDAETLRREGAHAFRLDRWGSPLTTRMVSGQRPWTVAQ